MHSHHMVSHYKFSLSLHDFDSLRCASYDNLGSWGWARNKLFELQHPPPTHRRTMYKTISTYVIIIFKTTTANVIYKFNPIATTRVISDSAVAPMKNSTITSCPPSSLAWLGHPRDLCHHLLCSRLLCPYVHILATINT